MSNRVKELFSFLIRFVRGYVTGRSSITSAHLGMWGSMPKYLHCEWVLDEILLLGSGGVGKLGFRA